MTKDIRGKVEQFLTFEVGRISVRSPLALGIASTAFLLSQAVNTLLPTFPKILFSVGLMMIVAREVSVNGSVQWSLMGFA